MQGCASRPIGTRARGSFLGGAHASRPAPVRPGRRHRRCCMSHLDALEQELRELKLTRLADQLQGFLADAAKQEWDYGTFLGNVVKGGRGARRDRRAET